MYRPTYQLLQTSVGKFIQYTPEPVHATDGHFCVQLTLQM